jgi:hypothetical protein
MLAANVPIYTEQGGTNMVIGDGATLTVQDGGTITVEAGGTLDGAGAIEVPDGSITAAKLAADAVTTVKILDDNVTTDKILDLNVTTGKLDDGAVTAAKAAIFVSPVTGGGILVGTGMEEDYAHDLGVVPSVVLVIPISTAGSMDAWAVTYGMSDAMNLKLNVSNMATFVALAWA